MMLTIMMKLCKFKCKINKVRKVRLWSSLFFVLLFLLYFLCGLFSSEDFHLNSCFEVWSLRNFSFMLSTTVWWGIGLRLSLRLAWSCSMIISFWFLYSVRNSIKWNFFVIEVIRNIMHLFVILYNNRMSININRGTPNYNVSLMNSCVKSDDLKYKLILSSFIN